MAAEASHLNVALAVAVFAVTHGPAVMGSAPETGDGVTPNVAAVAADPVLFVKAFLVGSTERAVAVGTGEAGPLDVDSVREPHVGRLTGINEPGSGGLRFQIDINKFCLSRRSAEFVGVTGGAGIVLGKAGEGTVAVESVAGVAIGSARFFGVRFVQEINGLRLMRIKNPGENNPSSCQGEGKTDRENKEIPLHIWSFGTQLLVEKKC